ncbi:hypothetical protein [Azohydromonas aeria]|uniref:hypothetical protein n=1 Tax=Azohydromonas aeria TaxID=2590212 RepID=UPI0012FCDAF7|nr:hypothetical protein [Azohydromonas aeria]
MSGASASLPDLRPALDAATNVGNGLASFTQVVASLSQGGAGSPLHGVQQAFGGVQAALDIDLSGLSQRLPRAIATIEHALPADALAFVEDLQGSYRSLQAFITDSPLVQQVGKNGDLQQTALALLEAVLQPFAQRLQQLGASLLDADTLQQVRDALALLQQLAAGQVPAAGELLEFLSKQLVGVAPDLLADARAHLDTALALLQPLSAAALEARIGAVRDAAAAAFQQLVVALRDFDPAQAGAYPALEALLQAWSDALALAFDAIDAACAALEAVVAAPAWDALFPAHAAVLSAVPLDAVPTVDAAVAAIAEPIEGLIQRLGMVLSPQDLAREVARATATLHAFFAESPLAQVREVLIGFIERIRQAVEAIPAERAQQAVSGMLQRAQQELQALGIDQVRSGIAGAFASASDFIDQNVGDQLLGGVNDALDGVLQQFRQLPIDDLGQALAGAVQQAGALIQQLAGELSSALDQLRELLAQLDGLDFKPLADEVIDEIDAIKARLAAIKPEALSDAERIAIQAGLSLLRAVDLDTLVENQLKKGYAEIDAQLTGAVNAVLAAWNDFRGRIVGFDGGAITQPVNALLDQAAGAVNQVNGTRVLAPLDALVDEALAQAQGLSPAVLLEPLKAPYARMMATVGRANPDVWVQPLRALHTEIDRLVTLIDITPLLDTLEQKERALFKQARDGLAAALDGLHLPAPLDTFLDTMKALMLGLADAVFADPDTALRQFNATLLDSVKPSSLFKPLDDAFDQLLAAVEKLPAADVLAALEALRAGLGAALPALDPGNVLGLMRAAQARLEALSPGALAGAATLPALRARLEARLEASAGHGAAKVSLRARFDAVLVPLNVDDANSRLRRLDARVRALSDALRRRINGLDAAAAQAAYARLDAHLSRLLPAFLRQPRPLTADDVRAGLATLRPSTRARRIDAAVERFLADLKPLQAQLDGAVNGFFGEVREAAQVLHPAGLKDAVSGVYAALRQKLQVLDPDELAGELRATLWEPLMDPLQAIDPAAIQVQLDALYQQLLAKLAGSLRALLAQLRQAIDGFLAQVRAALKQLLDALKAQLQAVLANVTALLKQLDELVVHDLLERLLTLLDNLEASFNRELERVRNEFDAMLDAIPLQSSRASASAAVAL